MRRARRGRGLRQCEEEGRRHTRHQGSGVTEAATSAARRRRGVRADPQRETETGKEGRPAKAAATATNSSSSRATRAAPSEPAARTRLVATREASPCLRRRRACAQRRERGESYMQHADQALKQARPASRHLVCLSNLSSCPLARRLSQAPRAQAGVGRLIARSRYMGPCRINVEYAHALASWGSGGHHHPKGWRDRPSQTSMSQKTHKLSLSSPPGSRSPDRMVPGPGDDRDRVPQGLRRRCMSVDVVIVEKYIRQPCEGSRRRPWQGQGMVWKVGEEKMQIENVGTEIRPAS